ncbi:hypothetical protein HZA56_13140 [Candidatus Poribacteria bacterium]|nr:hypothetical protein [Candidatus Poribacteria bacterium]
MRIAIFSLIPWETLRQRPHAIAMELARMGHEVYYVEPFVFSRKLHLLAREVFKSARLRESPESNIHLLCSPYFWSYEKYANYFFMNKVLSIRMIRLMRGLKIDFSIVLDPEYYLSMAGSGIPHAYDHVDDTQYMPGAPTERYIASMNRIKKTTAFNTYIQQIEAEKDAKGLFIPNGCYPEEFFPIDCEKKFDAVVIGSIASWFDMESILESRKQILIIGPMDIHGGTNLQKFLKAGRKNIYYIPEISKSIANLWVNSARVGLVPFKEDHPVVQYAMPVKILEYFLCNLPVVTFKNKGIERQYGDMVTYYSSTRGGLGLDDAIEAAMQHTNTFHYRQFASQHSWPAIARQLEKRVLEAVGQK